tara:strand:+ start:131 stop:853 length:723 start_codon:yes stop_codon:yes gene_type:complete
MIKPKKHFAQYFLKNKNIIAKIIKSADLKISDFILEIGPGTGVLTKELAKYAKLVIAVEKDKQMVNYLLKNTKKTNLQIIQSDILKLNINTLLRRYRISKINKIIANLPYYITGQFLKKFSGIFMVLMLQKEVAKRICSKKTSLLSLAVKSWGKPRIISYVSGSAFSPKPKVDSAIIKILPLKKKYKINFALAKSAFAQKRKQIGNTLDKKLLKKAKINPKLRPEDLDIKNWEILSKICG